MKQTLTLTNYEPTDVLAGWKRNAMLNRNHQSEADFMATLASDSRIRECGR